MQSTIIQREIDRRITPEDIKQKSGGNIQTGVNPVQKQSTGGEQPPRPAIKIIKKLELAGWKNAAKCDVSTSVEYKKYFKSRGYHVLVFPAGRYNRKIIIKPHTPGTRWSKKI